MRRAPDMDWENKELGWAVEDEDGILADGASGTKERSHPVAATSGRRIAGAALFAFLSALYVQKAASYTIPAIISMVSGVDRQAAYAKYDSSDLLRSAVLIVTGFICAIVAGFLARRRGILAGVLSNSPWILLLGYLLFASVVSGNPSFSKFPLVQEDALDNWFLFGIFLRLALIILAGWVGGFIGKRIYSPDKDLDAGHDKATIFGVRWPHYLWITPLVYEAFFCSAIMIVYAGAIALLAILSFAWHPSLWFSVLAGWILLPIIPLVFYLAVSLTAVGFVRFHKAMQYTQTSIRGWKRFWQVLLYGVAVPAATYTIAAIGVDLTHAMPKPVPGDWKIAVGLAALFVAINAIASGVSRLRGQHS